MSEEYTIKSIWKEEVEYREGDAAFRFPAAWGVTPFRLYVPAEVDWDHVTPTWMHGRRAEIVSRLERDSTHDVEVDPPMPHPSPERPDPPA